MVLKTILQQGYAKANVKLVVDYVGNDEERFAELMTVFLGNDYRNIQTVVWLMSYCIENQPFLIEKYWPRLIEVMQNSATLEAIRRNVVRMWQFIDIPEEYEGIVIDVCANNLTNPATAIATKAFSITVLEKLTTKYPDLAAEFCAVIADRLPYETPAFRSRGKRFLAKFQK